MSAHRFQLDRSAQLHNNVLIAGSPLRLFRLTDAGADVVRRVSAGEPVARSGLIDRFLDAGVVHPLPDNSGARFSPRDVSLVTPVFGDTPSVASGTIIVDDGSQPPVAGATIRLDANRGPAAARNAGLAEVTTSLVAFVDADVEVSDGWFAHLLPYFDDDRVAVVAPRVASRPGVSALDRYERAHSPLDLGDEPARVRAGSRVSYVPAAALVCRVEALREIGGFDETLHWGEDVDLVWRLDERGWRVRYVPDVVVEHRPRSSWPSWWAQRVAYGRSSAQLAKRHRGALAPLRMSGWSVASWVLGGMRHPIAGALVGVGSAVALVRKLPDVPPRAAFRLAAMGNAHAGDQIAQAVRRAWWPITAAAAIRSRTARRLLVASVIAARHPIKVIDDVAFALGVWHGAMTERTVGPLVPEINSWPGRRRPSPSSAER